MLKKPLLVPDYHFKAHLYDCDGTLADTMKAHIEAWVEELLEHGVSIPGSLIHELAGMPATRTVEIINQRYGASLDPEKIAKLKEDRFYEHYLHRIKPIEEVVDLLLESFDEGIKIGVVSGGRKRIVKETLKILGIEDKVGALICAEDVKQGKPHPEPFLMAAKILKVSPKECLVFEDGELGIQSAQAAQMQWVRVVT